jgi:hypothetical protein
MAREAKNNAPSAQKKSKVSAKYTVEDAVDRFAGCGHHRHHRRDRRHTASLVIARAERPLLIETRASIATNWPSRSPFQLARLTRYDALS